MQVNFAVPFYGNTPDDTHCSQASLRSIRKYFEPHLDFTWEQLDEASGKVPDKGTWRMAGQLWLRDNGYEILEISTIDYVAFADRGLDYWAEEYGDEAAAWEAEECNIPLERERARHFVQQAAIELRVPEQTDIRNLLDQGYLVQVTVNLRRLNGQDGFLGHSILVKGYDDEGFVAHDPGLPPQPERYVPNDLFEHAWSNGVPNFKVLNAVRLQTEDLSTLID